MLGDDATATGAAGRRELMAFCVGAQEYCVDVMAIREIRGWTPTTPLPQSPPHVRGVINLRGAVLPVVDLSCLLGLGVTAPGERSVIIVAQIAGRLVGLLVDAVSDIITVTNEMIQPTPDIACETIKNFVQGLLAMDGRLVSLLTLDRVLPAEAAAA
jgi:purine-binding chemotaxis protein CheW